MDKTLIIRGLPQSLARDGWWLDAPTGAGAGGGGGGGGQGPSQTAGARGRGRAGAVLCLVALADLLFWHHAPGLSLVVFAGAILIAAARLSGARAWRRPAGLFVLAALPVADHLQALSLLFLIAGLVLALVWLQRPEGPLIAVLEIGARVLGALPKRWLRLVDPRALWTPQIARQLAPRAGRGPIPVRALIHDWALPLGGGMVLIALLMAANPVLAQVLRFDLHLWSLVQRALFWTGVAVFVLPFLTPIPAEGEPIRLPALRLPGFGVNAGSVLRALVLFNAMLAVQSLTDLTILTGGAALPRGMTLAEYAHRGAYPLLATAILAGAFALAARPFLGAHRLIRPLLIGWLVQNMVLCGAAALRLELYIEAFGLTYLRLHALIWMGLVAAGLGMVLWQVLRGRSNGWLLGRAAMLGVGTLYLCSFINFAQIIAAQNVTRPDPDLAYLCALGPMAAGPLVESGLGRPTRRGIALGTCEVAVPVIRDWREWGFRTRAANRYVRRAMQTKVGP